jgi:hypothetical protein
VPPYPINRAQQSLSQSGTNGFESGSLQRRVCEPSVPLAGSRICLPNAAVAISGITALKVRIRFPPVASQANSGVVMTANRWTSVPHGVGLASALEWNDPAVKCVAFR